jgi:putative DNA primase/helicase
LTDLFADPAAPSGKTTALTLSDLLDRFSEVDQESDGWVVSCPAHSDSKPSLRVAWNSATKKVALRCRAACETSDVVEALGLKMADLFDVEPGDLADVRTASANVEKPSVGDRAALALYLQRSSAVLRDAL